MAIKRHIILLMVLMVIGLFASCVTHPTKYVTYVLVSGVSKWGLFVELKGNKCEGMVRYEDLPGDYYYLDDDNFRVIGEETGRVIQLGDEVRVRVKSVDLFKRKMDFEMLADTPRPSKKTKQKKGRY